MLRSRAPTIVASLCLAALAGGLALAEQAVGIGIVYWHTTQTIGTDSECITEAPGDADCALFPLSSQAGKPPRVVRIAATGAVSCCLVRLASIDVGGGSITDADGPYGSGQGSCVDFDTNGGVDYLYPDRTLLMNQEVPGLSPAACTGSIRRANETLVPLCDNDPIATGTAECAALGVGVCRSPPSTEASPFVAAFINCEAVTDPVDVRVRKEQSRR